MRRRLLPGLVLLLAAVAALLQCRRAEGVAEDPLDREATNAFTAYLRIDTSNPPGNETAGARFLHDLLTREGIEAQLVGTDPARKGVYARLRAPGSTEKALLLLSHIDVVPAIPSEWTRPPFGGVEAGGYHWGRGALDIKSLTIAWAMAMIDLKRRALPLKRDVVFLAVPDEEAGGLRGAAALLDASPELFANVGFVLNEGGYNETVVDHVRFWGIEVQQKVPLWVRLRAKGGAGHAASPPDDGGAVAKLVVALDGIAKIENPYRLTPEVEAYFGAAGKARNDERGEVLRNIRAELGTPRMERVLSPSYRALLRDTVTITHVAAGTSVNSIPANALAEVDVRLLPDQTTDRMLERIRAAAGENAEVEVMVAGKPTAPTSAETELFEVLEKRLESEEPRSVAVAVVGAGATDSRYFRQRGVVAYGIAPFKVNYYDAGTAHGNDERIRRDYFVQGVRLARKIVADFVATSAAPGSGEGPAATGSR